MMVKHLFASLMDQLEDIEREWLQSGSSARKEKLCREIMELRKVSDDILDHWLLFEERMSEMQQKVQSASDQVMNMEKEMDQIPDDVMKKIYQEIKNLDQSKPNSGIVAFLSGQAARTFRKGQGYYNLFMYPEAAHHFEEVIQQEPDVEIARMYLAFSEMMNGKWEQADHHFQLLSKTSEHRILQATALNAQGCILAVQHRWDQALCCFEKAVECYPKLKDPLFNKALVHMKQNQYHEAKSLWEEYIKHVPEDWEVLLQLAQCYMREGNYDQAEHTLKKIIETAGDPELLWEAAKMFEDLRQFGNAALCFHLLVSMDTTNAAAWHGLGWNLWHEEGQPAGVEYIKKAIQLSPKNPDYQFSYGWILVHLQEYDEAESIFRSILEMEPNYPLALAGLVQIYVAREKWKQADDCCQQLIGASHKPTKALGHLQRGRMDLVQGHFEHAKHQFKQSIQAHSDMLDSFLWLGLAHYLLGEREDAITTWEYTL